MLAAPLEITRSVINYVIGVGRCFMVRGPNLFSVDNQPRSDVRSLLCLFCCTKQTEVIGAWERAPPRKF